MPIHDVGYRKWDGKRTGQFSRFWIITRTGIRLASSSPWVRRMLFFAWLPVLYWSMGFFIVDGLMEDASTDIVIKAIEKTQVFPQKMVQQAKTNSARFQNNEAIAFALRHQFRMIPNVDSLAEAIRTGDKASTQHTLWAWLLMTFFRYPQALLILFLVGSIAPTLISRDLRSRAFLLYFSRPIGKLEYLLGKLLVPLTFIVFVTTLPALVLYLLAVLLTPDFSILVTTWDLPLRILASTVVLVLPLASLSLMLSSLTHESRFASFSWFAVWALGHGAWVAILFATAIRMRRSPFDAIVANAPMVKNWSVLSLYNNLGDIQSYIFGFESFSNIWPGAIVLAAITIISLVVLYRRISAPVRI